MTRDVRYTCKRHGPFLSAAEVGPNRKAPTRARCPHCLKPSPRVHHRKSASKSISVRGETYEKLALEADRRGVPLRWIVEEITEDIV